LLPGILALLVLDLFTINGGNNSEPGVYDVANAIPRTRSLLTGASELGRIRLTADTVLPGNYGALARIETIDGDSPIQDARLQTLLAVPDEWRLWELFNVRYVLSRNPLSVPGLTQLFEEDGLLLYQMQEALPRAYAARSIEVFDDSKRALDNVMNSDTHPGDRAVVEEEPPIELPGRLVDRPSVHVVTWGTQSLELAVESREPAYVVVSMPYDSGWRATMDARPVMIQRTNYALMGIAVEAGEHRIQLRYDPILFKVGAVVSVTTVLAFIAVVGFSRLLQ
jgi:hypothetical protein